jgi:alkaline phosphatase D
VITRRSFLVGTSSSLVACRVHKSPQVVVPAPLITHGVQSGDVSAASARVWARCSEPARMLVEWTTSNGHWRRVPGPVVTTASDLAASVQLTDLPDGQRITYRVHFEREAARGGSDVVTGSFATPRATKLRVAWSGDTCGQGFGRNPDWGGLRGYAALRKAQPDVFINSGDLIYADNPIEAEHVTVDGRRWRNISNERVARVAQELDDFRARFAYNLEDEHLSTFLRDVAVIAQWDDHETRNNWWPGQQLDDKRYTTVRDASTLAERARQAFFEWNAIAPGSIHRVIRYGPLLDIVVLDARSFRRPNDAGVAPNVMIGVPQASWLVKHLERSSARFKLVACDQPLALVIPDDDRQEGFANGIDGPPAGREVELASIFTMLKKRGVKNVAWVTADVHYAAAHHFDGARVGLDYHPFWEFVAGPIHAGTFGPNQLDPSLGPELKFIWAPPPGTGNLPPSDGLQSFGTIDVTKDALAVALWGIDGRQRWAIELPYEA